jgi:hypothetical protein
MKTPKQKAIELIDNFIQINGNSFCAIQCAIRCVDEILENFGTLTEGKQHYAAHCTIKYYEEVKEEILIQGGNK